RDAGLRRPGDDPGPDRGDGDPGGALPVRPVHGGRLAVRAAARSRPRHRGGFLVGQVGGDVLRRDHDGKALAVGGLVFCKPWSGGCLFKTPSAVAGGHTFGSGPRLIMARKGQSRAKKSSQNEPKSLEIGCPRLIFLSSSQLLRINLTT